MKTTGRFCARPSQQEQQGLLGAEQYQNGATRTQISPVSCRENTVFRGRLNVRWVSPHRAECSDGIQGTWRFICCFCDWKSFRQVGGEAPAAPVGAEIKSEVTDYTHLQSENLQKLDQEEVFRTVDIHTWVAPATLSLNWVSFKLRSGRPRPPCSLIWIFPAVDVFLFILCTSRIKRCTHHLCCYSVTLQKSEKPPSCVIGMKLCVLSCCSYVACSVITCMWHDIK